MSSGQTDSPKTRITQRFSRREFEYGDDIENERGDDGVGSVLVRVHKDLWCFFHQHLLFPKVSRVTHFEQLFSIYMVARIMQLPHCA